MPGMATGTDTALPDTTACLLGRAGAVVAGRFADRIASLGLKPRHVDLLAMLAAADAASQLDVATELRVAPSLVVRLADHLEAGGAIERTRDPQDRRRQTLQLTDHGRRVLAECATITQNLANEVLAGLDAADEKALRSALRKVGANLGL